MITQSLSSIQALFIYINRVFLFGNGYVLFAYLDNSNGTVCRTTVNIEKAFSLH